MRICSFNVNSIRARKDLFISWLEHRNNDIDILCLQEIKVVQENFPGEEFKRLGYQCRVFGQKGYNGVALCTKIPMEHEKRGFGDDHLDQQRRLIQGRVGETSVINIYAPHGDFRGTDKFRYKLDWYEKLISFLEKYHSPDEKAALVGDFNVAWENRDVYNPEILEDTIGTMDEERSVFKKLLDWGLVDAFRSLYPDKKQFTWWDYIGGAIWRDQGMRIDYILCTKPLLKKLRDVEVDLWPRKRRKPTPSDHAPVIATFEGEF
ncbi:MAG: exodeoxyribonuclease III [Candidatus Aminicenantes bacterium]